MLEPAFALAREFPKTAGLLIAISATVGIGSAIHDARKPSPPPPAPWTAQERAAIVRCAENWSAGWCADNILRLREVLK